MTEALKAGNEKKLLCISTQVIEAGVDISFDAVIRLCAGLDSIVQAAGRCNRNGECEPDAPVWIVDCLDENLSLLNDIRDAKKATESLIYSFEKEADRFDSDLSSDKSVRFFYENCIKQKALISLILSEKVTHRFTQCSHRMRNIREKRMGDFACIRRSEPPEDYLKYLTVSRQASLFRGATERRLPKS